MASSLFLLFTFTSALVLRAAAAPSKPHLIFVLIDDLGFNDFSWRSSDLKDVAWPNVNNLLAEGLQIDTYYTQPICTPTRGAFLSGRYPVRLGLQHTVIMGFQDYGLPLDEVTLADKLTDAGYKSYIVGKWHQGCYSFEATPTYRGFESFYGYWNGMEDYYTHEIGDLLDLHRQVGENHTMITTQSNVYGTNVLAAEMDSMIKNHVKNNPDTPGFFYYPLQNVHVPLEVPDAYLSKCASIPNTDRRTFCAMAAVADEAIGNLTSTLVEQFQGEDFLVVMAGDNGGIVNGAGNNFPLRGMKGQLWEGGVRNNALVWGSLLPAAVRGTTYSKGLVHVTDWHATFAALAGATLKGKASDGVDVWDALTKNIPSPRSEFLVNHDPCVSPGHDPTCQGEEWAYRMGDWKLLMNVAAADVYPTPTNVSSSYSAAAGILLPGGGVAFPSDSADLQRSAADSYQLFNMTADPTEATDLSSEYPDVVSTITAKVNAIITGSDYLKPCNVEGGACLDDDPNGQSTCDEHGGWYPWVN